MKTIFKIFLSELKKVLTDPGCALIMVGGVFMYTLFYTIPFSTHVLKDVPIGVIDNDNSSFSRELVRNFDSSEMLKVVSRPLDLQDAQNQFYKNEIRAYVEIPKGFEKDVLRGGHSFVSLFEDSAYLIVYKQITTGIMQTTGTMSAKIEIGKLMKKGLNKQMATAVKLPFEFIQMPLYNPAGSYQNYIYPLVVILILQQTMLVGVGLLGGTRRELIKGVKRRTKDGVKDVIESYCEFSTNPTEIVLGRAFAYVVLYLIYSVICFLVFPAFLVYEMTYNIPLLLLILFPFLFSVAFLSQALIYFYANREHALLTLVVMSLPLIFLPGFVWPKESMSFSLIAFSKIIPATSAMDGLLRVNQMGAQLYQIQTDVITLCILCVLYFVLACAVAKKVCK